MRTLGSCHNKNGECHNVSDEAPASVGDGAKVERAVGSFHLQHRPDSKLEFGCIGHWRHCKNKIQAFSSWNNHAPETIACVDFLLAHFPCKILSKKCRKRACTVCSGRQTAVWAMQGFVDQWVGPCGVPVWGEGTWVEKSRVMQLLHHSFGSAAGVLEQFPQSQHHFGIKCWTMTVQMG